MNENNRSYIVDNLSKAIKKIGSNILVAKTYGVSGTTVSRWRTGISCPDFEIIVDIAKRANVSVDWIVGGQDYSKPTPFYTPEHLKDVLLYTLRPLADREHQLLTKALFEIIEDGRVHPLKSMPVRSKQFEELADYIKSFSSRVEPNTSNVVQLHPEKPTYRPTVDLPLHGTAAGSLTGSISISSDVIEMLDRPEGLKDAHNAYALIVTGESMVPRYAPGDVVFINPDIEPHQDDYVIVQTQDHASAPVSSYIKRFVSRSEKSINVTQYNPPVDIEFTANNVKAVHRVMPADELYGLKL